MSIAEAMTAALSVFPRATVSTSHGDLPLVVVMVAIAGAESGWTPNEDGDCGLGGPSCGSCSNEAGTATSWGLWQIHNVHADMLTRYSGSSDPCVWRSWLFDPTNNAKAAFAVYSEQGLEAWTTWNHGQWSEHIGAAQQAYSAAMNPPPGPSVAAFVSTPTPQSQATAAPSVRWGMWGAVAAGVLAAAATVAVVETDVHWASLREWFVEQIR